MANTKIPPGNDLLLRANIIGIVKEATRHGAKCVKGVNDEKTIHHYRLAVKKMSCIEEMDAMMELSIFNRKVIEKYKALFDVLGVLRDWNLLEDRYIGYAKMNVSGQFVTYLHKKETKALAGIKKQAIKTGNLQQQTLINKVLVRKLDYKPFHDYYLQRMQQTVELLVTAAIENKNWHRLRKQLKRCTFLAQIIGKEPHKAFVELQKLLGKWHDAHVQLLFVQKYMDKHDDTLMKGFRKELKKRRKILTKQVEAYLTTVT